MIGSALRFLRDTRAGPLVAFALVLPMLVAMIFTGFEIARLILANQKVANAASIVADLVGQTEDILTESDLAQLMGAARRVGEPFDLEDGGRVIVSSFTIGGARLPRLNWRRIDNGHLAASSRIAEALPEELTDPDLPESELITTEVFFRYTPAVFSFVDVNTTVYHFALVRPRVRSMETPPVALLD